MLINIGKRYFRNVVFLATWSLFPWQQPKIDKNTKIPTNHQICKNNNAYQHKILLNLKKKLITLNFAFIWKSECQSIISQIAFLTFFIIKFKVFLKINFSKKQPEFVLILY